MSNADVGQCSSNRIGTFVPMSWDWYLKQAKRMRLLVGKDVISSGHAEELLAKVFGYKDKHELYKWMTSGEGLLTVWDRDLSQSQASSRRGNQIAAIVDNLGVTEAAAVAILDEGNFTNRLPIPKGTKPTPRNLPDSNSEVTAVEKSANAGKCAMDVDRNRATEDGPMSSTELSQMSTASSAVKVVVRKRRSVVLPS
jgi:hypothetical protein